MNLEDRLRTAVQAEADRVEPDETASLDTIRTRGRTARRRRRALGGSLLALLVAGAVVLAPRVSDDNGQDIDTIGRPDRTTTTEPETTVTTPETTTATAPQSTTAESPTSASTTTATTEAPPTAPGTRTTAPVLWPGPEHAPFTDPTEAARSFMQESIGFSDPALSAFRSGGASAGVGEIDVYWRGEDGQPLARVASTLSLLRDQGQWYVVRADSADVAIDAPAPNTGVASPLTVQGRGRGYEGTINIEVRAAFAGSGQALGRATVTAGGGEDLVPFSTAITFSPSGSAGAVVATTDTGLTGGTVSFTAYPVTFD